MIIDSEESKDKQIERDSITGNQSSNYIWTYYENNINIKDIYQSVLHFWKICINFNMIFSNTPVMHRADKSGPIVYNLIIGYFEGMYSKNHINEMNKIPLLHKSKEWMYRLCSYAFKRPSILKYCANGFHARRRIWTAFTRF